VPLGSAEHFLKLASRHLRFTLIELARHHAGPMSFAGKKATDRDGKAADDRDGLLASLPGAFGEPGSLEDWTRFHEAVGRLPDAEHEVFHLLWYQGLTQEAAAEELGVDVRTVRRRWLKAKHLLRLMLSEVSTR
jgi:RNA polymerase sigma-70 factor (ECF subfamily)